MITRQEILRLLHRADEGRPVLSVFLDTSVNAVNQRTYPVFLDKERARHAELDSERAGHHREAIGAAYDRVAEWLDREFDPANKGVAIYTELGGDWFEGLQFPVPVRNRIVVSDRPVVGPLAQIVESHHRYGLIAVDREHLRLVVVQLGQPFVEHEVRTQAYPAPHDVKSGGEAAKDRQKRKAEEVRHFFKEFALEVAEFDRRYRPDEFVVLGTRENVKQFIEFLAAAQRAKVVHTEHAPVAAPVAELTQRLAPFFDAARAAREAAVVDRVRGRVGQRHRAVAGFTETLVQLQEGKVETLVLARDAERGGARCLQCGFFLAREDADCPYCGGAVEPGIDLVEAIVRLAEEQEIELDFVAPEAVVDLNGIGALLRF